MSVETNKTFQFDLVSPDAVLVSEQVRQVTAPGMMGEFGVLADHAPLLSALKPGVVKTTSASGEESLLFVTGGVADINNNLFTLLAEEAINLNEINAAELREAVATLKEEHSRHIGMEEEHYIQRQLEIAVAKLDAVEVYAVK